MTINFPLILASLTLFTGIIVLMDYILSKFKMHARVAPHPPVTIEYARAFFPVLLIVFIIRSFIIQPYRVPSGSLEPTIRAGDFILVNQYDYGVRLPVWDKKIVSLGLPQRGQIALFYYPVNRQLTFVKRVVGVPGDHITYADKILYVNGQKMPQTFVGYGTDYDMQGRAWKVAIYEEDLSGVKHKIYVKPSGTSENFYDLVVPKGRYFMMGDNRDNSEDSRYWGFVPQHDFIGRALIVWMSWDANARDFLHKVRWDRIGKKL